MKHQSPPQKSKNIVDHSSPANKPTNDASDSFHSVQSSPKMSAVLSTHAVIDLQHRSGNQAVLRTLNLKPAATNTIQRALPDTVVVTDQVLDFSNNLLYTVEEINISTNKYTLGQKKYKLKSNIDGQIINIPGNHKN